MLLWLSLQLQRRYVKLVYFYIFNFDNFCYFLKKIHQLLLIKKAEFPYLQIPDISEDTVIYFNTSSRGDCSFRILH